MSSGFDASVRKLRNQQASRLLSHLRMFDADRGERRTYHVHKGHVVMPDNRHVIRAFHASRVEFAIGPKRDQVIARDYGRKIVRPREKRGGGFSTCTAA